MTQISFHHSDPERPADTAKMETDKIIIEEKCIHFKNQSSSLNNTKQNLST